VTDAASHAHGAHHHFDPQRLVTASIDDAGFYAAVADDLIRPTDRLVLDIGCGGGGMALAMARRLAPGGRVVAVDLHDDVLDAARAHVLDGLGKREYGARVDFLPGALEDGVGGLRAAIGGDPDVVWASAVIHHFGDQQGAVDTLAALLAVGGRLALHEAGLNPRHLPWELEICAAGLESRLEAAVGRWFAGMRAAIPTSKPLPYGWTQALRRAGLTGVRARSYLIEQPPPLPMTERRRVLDELARRVARADEAGALPPEDVVAWSRLLDPEDAEWLGHREDVHRLEARTVHTGTRPSR
jgi:SAM-dependent methyltransferase